MDEIKQWPGSIVQQHMLIDAIGKFLRTHHNGGQRLKDLMQSVAPDRTEEEYRELRERAAVENEQAIQKGIAEYNERRAAQGQPPIDRNGNVIV
jgi:hypothetical protein